MLGTARSWTCGPASWKGNVNANSIKPTTKLSGLDLGRFIAALSVIWIHSPEYATDLNAPARFAVPFFAATATYFSLNGDSKSASAWIIKRIQRVYLPFLVWGFVYLIAQVAGKVVLGGSVPALNWGALLLQGTVHHLWFLPFIFWTGIFMRPLASNRIRKSSPVAVATLLLALGASLCLVPRSSTGIRSYLLGLSYDNLPAVFWAASLALLLPETASLGAFARKHRLILRLALCSGLAALSVLGRQVPLENLTGLLALLVFSGLDLAPTAQVQVLGDASLGIYLSHVLFIEGLQDGLRAAGVALNNTLASVAVFVFASAGSLSLALILRRWDRMKGLV